MCQCRLHWGRVGAGLYLVVLLILVISSIPFNNVNININLSVGSSTTSTGFVTDAPSRASRDTNLNNVTNTDSSAFLAADIFLLLGSAFHSPASLAFNGGDHDQLVPLHPLRFHRIKTLFSSVYFLIRGVAALVQASELYTSIPIAMLVQAICCFLLVIIGIVVGIFAFSPSSNSSNSSDDTSLLSAHVEDTSHLARPVAATFSFVFAILAFPLSVASMAILNSMLYPTLLRSQQLASASRALLSALLALAPAICVFLHHRLHSPSYRRGLLATAIISAILIIIGSAVDFGAWTSVLVVLALLQASSSSSFVFPDLLMGSVGMQCAASGLLLLSGLFLIVASVSARRDSSAKENNDMHHKQQHHDDVNVHHQQHQQPYQQPQPYHSSGGGGYLPLQHQPSPPPSNNNTNRLLDDDNFQKPYPPAFQEPPSYATSTTGTRQPYPSASQHDFEYDKARPL